MRILIAASIECNLYRLSDARDVNEWKRIGFGMGSRTLMEPRVWRLPRHLLPVLVLSRPKNLPYRERVELVPLALVGF
jgi:hypothetical protein